MTLGWRSNKTNNSWRMCGLYHGFHSLSRNNTSLTEKGKLLESHMMEEKAQTPRRGAIHVLRNRNFAALWIGQTISFVGDYFYWLAVPILVERLTGSALMVGLSLISTTLPMLLLGPLAGVLVDRWDRRRTMIAADVLRALLVLPCLLVRSADQVWVYYAVGFAMSAVSRFFFPARSAVLPLIVTDPDDLLIANGLMQVVQTVGLLAGPALAGFAIGFWGEQIAFGIDSLSFLISAVAILVMTVPRTTQGRQASGGQWAALWTEMRDGAAYLFGNRTMVGVLICLIVVQLGIGAINVVWVPYLQRFFGLGPEGLGLVDGVQGAGMLVSGLALGWMAARLNKIVLASASIALIGAFLGGMGLVSQLTPLLLLSFGVGLALVPVLSVMDTMIQLAVPDLKRGRVNSVMNALTMSASLLSMAAASLLGETIGLRTIYVICGLFNVAAGVLGLFVLKEP